MSFEDWVANFTVVSLCAVGTAPVPVEEEDPEDEDVDQDALSSEEEDPFSAFVGKTKNQTNEKIAPGKYTNFANSERYLLWQQHLYLLPPLQRCYNCYQILQKLL